MRTTSRRTRLGLACLTSLAVLAPASTAGAVTWTSISSGMSGTDIIRSVDYQAGRLALVTDSGKIGVGTSTGITNVSPTYSGIQFRDVAFKPGTDIGIAVGSNGRIMRTTNAGLSWGQVSWSDYSGNCGSDQLKTSGNLPTTANPALFLNSVTWGTDDKVYITGENATLLRSSDNGASFTDINKSQITEPGFPTYWELSCTGPNDTYWDLATLPVAPGTPDSARPFYFMSDTDVYYTSNSLAGVPAKRANLGCGGGIRNFVLDPVNPNRQWSATDRGSNSACLYFTTDDTNYVGFRLANADSANASTRVASGGDGPTVLSVGKGGDVFTSTDGTNFYRVPAGGALATQDWYSASGFDASNFAVGGAGAKLMVTNDATALPVTPAPGGGTPGGSTPPVTTPPVTTPPVTRLPSPTLPSKTAPPVTGKAAKILGKYVVFKVKGKLGLPVGLARKAACKGTMSISVYKGKKRLKNKTVTVDSKCGYKTTVKVKRSKVGKKTKKLKLKVAFRGNTVLGKLSSTYNVKVKR